MKSITIIILSFFLVISVGVSQTIKKSVNIDSAMDVKLLAVSPSKNYIIYLTREQKNKEFKLKFYNVETSESKFLTKKSYPVETEVIFGVSDNTFLVSTGKSIFNVEMIDSLSIELIYQVENEEQNVSSLTLNYTDKYLAFILSEGQKDFILIKDLKIDRYKILSEASMIKGLEYSKINNTLFVIEGDDLKSYQENGETNVLANNLEDSYLKSIGSNLFYSKEDKFLAFNLKNQNQNILLEVNALRVNDIFEVKSETYLISFNNQLMLHDNPNKNASIIYSSQDNSNIIFCSENYLIERKKGGVSELNILKIVALH